MTEILVSAFQRKGKYIPQLVFVSAAFFMTQNFELRKINRLSIISVKIEP
jgi:hypothetical protein